MTAGTYVGRVGGLAVALGIGAAILAGQGVASADDGGGSESKSASSTSKTSDSPTPKDTAKADAADQSSEKDPTVKKRRSSTDRDQAPADDPETEVADAAPEPESTPEPDADEGAPADKPEVVSTAISTIAPAVSDGSDTDGSDTDGSDTEDSDNPAAPAESTLALTVLATARGKADEETSEPAAAQATTSVAAAADEYPIPTDVVVTEWTPPLEWLQKVPVFGRFVMTPLVGLLHNIPLIGDILHPVFGFPIDHAAPPGTPRARSFRVTSFDGTRIFVNFMPAQGLSAGQSAPTVLNGPGVSLPGSTALTLDVDSLLPDDVIGIGALRKAGYNVVTWDPRGEWRSEGRMQLQSPDFEGRDVSHIISYLATLDEVQTVDGDPKIGMVGASYGGGIQLSTATIDHRIDAIVPTIAWNSLAHSLFPNGAVRNGWGTILSTALVLTLSRPNERVLPATITGVLTGKVLQSDLDLFESLNFADRLGDITTPTLLIQGTVDTLLPLSQADLNARALIAAGTTTKVVWYCGGHGTCLSSVNNGDLVVDRTLDWLDRHVKGEDIDTGEQFEWVDQNGDWYSSDSYPAPEDLTPIVAQRTEDQSMLYFPFIGGSGPNPLIITRGLIATLLGLPSAAPAVNAVNLKVTLPDDEETTHVVGAPEVTLTYSGTGTATHVWAQIVDDKTGLVLGNHTTPIPVQLDGDSHTVTVALEQVAHTLAPGQSVTVQIVTSSFAFLNFYSGGAITIDEVSVRLPTLAAGQATQTVAA